MAKKTRKVLKQESQQRAIQQAATNVNTALTAAAAQPAAADTPAAAPRTVKTAENTGAEDFRYVKSDLRRITLLAVSFSAILVVLSFFIK